MKTSKVISALFIVLMIFSISGMSSYAANPVPGPADRIQKMIKESIKYPEKAIRNGCCGTVDVTFTVDTDGKINIKKMSTENKDVYELVKQQLSSVCCKGIKTPFNQHYKVSITYKLI
jgi:outer membrane biosynthesis protein TonB